MPSDQIEERVDDWACSTGLESGIPPSKQGRRVLGFDQW